MFKVIDAQRMGASDLVKAFDLADKAAARELQESCTLYELML